MGQVQCPIHGRTGVTLVCVHVAAAMAAHRALPATITDADLIGRIRLCSACRAEHAGFAGKAPDSFFEASTGACQECFSRWQTYHPV